MKIREINSTINNRTYRYKSIQIIKTINKTKPANKLDQANTTLSTNKINMRSIFKTSWKRYSSRCPLFLDKRALFNECKLDKLNGNSQHRLKSNNKTSSLNQYCRNRLIYLNHRLKNNKLKQKLNNNQLINITNQLTKLKISNNPFNPYNNKVRLSNHRLQLYNSTRNKKKYRKAHPRMLLKLI